MKINPNDPAFPCATDEVLCDPKSERVHIVMRGGLTIRAHIATQAMQGMLAAGYGEEGYVPQFIDSDFVEDDEGRWCCIEGVYATWRGDTRDKRYRMVTTFEQRMARDAVSQADALIAELNKEATP